MKKITALLLALMLSLTLIFVVSCNDETEAPATSSTATNDSTGADDTQDKIPAEGLWASATYRNDTTLGQGETTFTVVVEIDNQSVNFTINTNKSTVGEALLELNLIEGEEGAYGLYVKKVNGVLADYDVDATYWAFYINGDYAMSGVDTTEVVGGTTYKMTRAK